jgi:NAD(P)-dependent dehydrogenase (short-subunit alcohol dehydrogenase family)
MTTNEGKVALVTGASYGLGMMTADFLARDGFDIAVTDLNTDDLAETVAMVEKRGRKAFATELDVRSVDSIDAAIAATVEGMGKIDVLINNAGVPLSKPALDVEPEEFDNVQNINVRGCYFMCQRFARHLVGTDRQGAIVNLSSTFAVIGVPGVSVYGISKAAVAGITRHLAADWAKYGIRVNAVGPGATETKIRAANFAANPEVREWNLSRIPMGRFGEPEDTAEAVAYLAGNKSEYINGHLLLVDGALTVT